MNFLAHLHLSDGSDEGLLGSLMGDFVKGPLDDRYPPGITRGIALHRRIDTFTDAHPVVLASKARIAPERRRFAGIMVDVFYDHYLARDWDQHSDVPLTRFSQQVYALLARSEAVLPERLRAMAPFMARGDWLGSYAEVEAIHTALDRMSRRFRRENALLGSAIELEKNYAALESDFRAFLPDLRRYVGEETRLMSAA